LFIVSNPHIFHACKTEERGSLPLPVTTLFLSFIVFNRKPFGCSHRGVQGSPVIDIAMYSNPVSLHRRTPLHFGEGGALPPRGTTQTVIVCILSG